MDVPGEYRARHIETGEQVLFHRTGTTIRKAEKGSKAGMGAPSAEEIAKKLADPNSNMGTLSTHFKYKRFDGDLPDSNNQGSSVISFQPSLPYSLSKTTNLFIRPTFPVIIDKDVPKPNGGFESEGAAFGDISFDASVLKSYRTGFMFGGGIVGTLPTATNDALGNDQWLLGPEVIGAVVRKWGVLGLLVSYKRNVAGDDDFDTSITGGQYFYTFHLKDGWTIHASPSLSYNHEASSGNEWTVPIGVGMTKTTIMGGRPWKFGFEYDYYVLSPDQFGPDWGIKFTVSPVVELPW